jgi:hypothetical protein
MCISSRQTSQGTQRIYTVNTTPVDRTRQVAYDSDDDNNVQRYAAPDDEDDVQKASSSSNLAIDTDFYEVSNDCMEDSPYLTKTATTVMRSISYVSSSDSEKSDSEKEAEAEAEDDLMISP